MCKKWQATENWIFSKDLYDWRASLALNLHTFASKNFDFIFAVIFEILNVEN